MFIDFVSDATKCVRIDFFLPPILTTGLRADRRSNALCLFALVGYAFSLSAALIYAIQLKGAKSKRGRNEVARRGQPEKIHARAMHFMCMPRNGARNHNKKSDEHGKKGAQICSFS